jgi:hypothetical protein
MATVDEHGKLHRRWPPEVGEGVQCGPDGCDPEYRTSSTRTTCRSSTPQSGIEASAPAIELGEGAGRRDTS